MMPFISDDVAAFAKREHAHRTRLAGVVALVLAFSLFILPAFDSPITSITGNSRLLGPLDLCRRDRDECPTDQSKSKPGICGCGVPDTDTDGDGTPDCKDGCPRDASQTSPVPCGCGIPDTDGDGTLDCQDGCPRDASKTNYGACGCGSPDTDTDGDGTLDCHDRCPDDADKTSPGVCGCDAPDTDTDGDGTLDCRDDCMDNDPSIHFCDGIEKMGCEVCGGKYTRLWTDCGLLCLSDIDYCVHYSYEDWHSLRDKRFHSYYLKVIQTGADSSNSVLEFWSDYSHEQTFVNGVPCIDISNNTVTCLVCDDGNEYCQENGVPVLPSNPWFFTEDEVLSMWYTCWGLETATTSQFEMQPIGSKLSQYGRAFFNHDT